MPNAVGAPWGWCTQRPSPLPEANSTFRNAGVVGRCLPPAAACAAAPSAATFRRRPRCLHGYLVGDAGARGAAHGSAVGDASAVVIASLREEGRCGGLCVVPTGCGVLGSGQARQGSAVCLRFTCCGPAAGPWLPTPPLGWPPWLASKVQKVPVGHRVTAQGLALAGMRTQAGLPFFCRGRRAGRVPGRSRWRHKLRT